MLLHWSDVYKTGHPEIDKQHKQIIEAMNELHLAVTERKGEEAVSEILNFLNSYVKDHFTYEEQCVIEFQCPHAEKNKEAHQSFVKLLDETKVSIDKGHMKHPDVMNFYYEIVVWIKDHILEIDKHNFNCVRDQLRAKFDKDEA